MTCTSWSVFATWRSCHSLSGRESRSGSAPRCSAPAAPLPRVGGHGGSPVVTLRRSSAEARLLPLAPKLAALGALVIAVSLGSLWASGRSLLFAYVGLFGMLVGAALMCPRPPQAVRADSAARDGRPVRHSRQDGSAGHRAALTRTSIALAALTIAVSTTVGVGIMVHSFRGNVAEWLETSLKSDIFSWRRRASSRAKGTGPSRPRWSSASAARWALPRSTPFAIGGFARATARSISTCRSSRIRADSGIAFVREAQTLPSGRRGRGRGSRLRAVCLPQATRSRVGRRHRHRSKRPGLVPSVGVYVDYASDEGGVIMGRAVYERHFEDPRHFGARPGRNFRREHRRAHRTGQSTRRRPADRCWCDRTACSEKPRWPSSTARSW